MALAFSFASIRVGVEALSGRERILLAVVILAALVAVADLCIWGPQRQRTQTLQAQAVTQRAGIAALTRAAQPPGAARQSATPASGSAGSDTASTANSQGLHEAVREAKTLLQRAQDDAGIGATARSVIAQSRGVTLRSLQTRPAQPWFKPSAKAAASAPSGGLTLPTLYLHAVDLRVEGSYDEVVRFLQRLESQDPPWFWPSVSVSVTAPNVVQLQATVHALSTQANTPLK